VVKSGTQIPLDSSLQKSPERSVGLVLPAVLSDRLDRLVALAEEYGERTSRREIVAALLLAAEPSGAVLSERIQNYRRAHVSSALIGGTAGETYTIIRSKPGPRTRQAEVT